MYIQHSFYLNKSDKEFRAILIANVIDSKSVRNFYCYLRSFVGKNSSII